MTIFEIAEPATMDLIEFIAKKYHPDLIEKEVKIGCFMATGGLTLHGAAAVAIVKINSYKDRVQGKPDATIFIDAEEWQDADDGRKAALLDHELFHLMVQKEPNGNAKTDDLGRPKLRMRPHDQQFGWFNVIAQRHGDASYEVKQAKEIASMYGQTYFGWSKPPAGGSELQVENSGRRVTTADGRTITAKEMMGEISAKFSAEVSR